MFYKNIYSNILRLKISNENFADETVLRIVDNASADFDYAFDARKLFEINEGIPQIFSEGQNDFVNMAINSFAPSENTAIPLVIKTTEGVFTISATEFLFDNVKVWLNDKYNSLTYEILPDFSLQFVTQGGIVADRFELIFAKEASQILENRQNINLEIYPNPASEFVFIDTKGIYAEYNIQISTITGQKVFENIFTEKIAKINLEKFSGGIYIVKIFADNKLIENKKIVIRQEGL